MTIEKELDDELKEAMRAQDRSRLDVIRQIRTEVAKAAAAPGGGGADREQLHEQIIASYVKKMDKARREYEGYGKRGAEMVQKLSYEIEYLSRWLPDAASSEELGAIVAKTISEIGATDPKQAGQVIGRIMKNHQGVDGGEVNRLVRAALGG